MVRKLIIIMVMILLVPLTLALVIEPLPKITNNKTLCIKINLRIDDTAKFYIDKDNTPQKILLEDGRSVDEISTPGNSKGCINLHEQVNKVKILYKYPNLDIFFEEFDVTLDTKAPELKNINIPDITNTLNPKFNIHLDESATLIINVSRNVETKEVSTGDNTLELNLNEGENTIRIEAEDKLGNKKTIIDKKIIADTKNPKVIIESVDDKQYTSGMALKADFQIVKIKGKTEPGTDLKIYNVSDIDYVYRDGKLFKQNNEEIKSEGKVVELDKDGNFEEYISLNQGKNILVFLATDKAGNQNYLRAQDRTNIETNLIINYESGANWRVSAVSITQKIKARDLLKSEMHVKAEVRFSPKNIDSNKLREVRLSISPQQDQEKADNRRVRISGQPSAPYYDEKKKEYVSYTDIIVNQWPGRIEDISGNIRPSLDGKINFFVGNLNEPLMERVPIDLLFWVEVENTKLLNPVAWLFSDDKVEKSLAHIGGAVKNIQTIALWDAGICAIAKLWNKFISRWVGHEPTNAEKKAEYFFCDRIICYDTAPTAKYYEKAIEKKYNEATNILNKKSELMTELSKIKEEINKEEGTVNQIETNVDSLVNNIRFKENQIKQKEEQMRYESETAGLEMDIEEIQKEIEEIQKEIKEKWGERKKILDEIEKNGKNEIKKKKSITNVNKEEAEKQKEIEFENKLSQLRTSTVFYQPGAPYYHEVSCLPNMLRSQSPLLAPVKVEEDLFSSAACGCLPGTLIHLQNLYLALSAVQGCKERAKYGDTDLGMCDVETAKAACSLMFWGIEKYLKNKNEFQNIYTTSYNVRGPTSQFIDIINIRNIPGQVKGIDLRRVGSFFDLKNSETYQRLSIYEQACTNLVSGDWHHITTTIETTAMEAIPSFGEPIVISEIKEENGDLIIEYFITPVIIAGTHPIQWEMNFKCDSNKKNYNLCKDFLPTYATTLEHKGPILRGTIPSGGSLNHLDPIRDDDLTYWFNSIELKLTRFVTSLGYEITDTADTEIDKNVDKLSDLCAKYKDGNYGICKDYIQEVEESPLLDFPPVGDGELPGGLSAS